MNNIYILTLFIILAQPAPIRSSYLDRGNFILGCGIIKHEVRQPLLLRQFANALDHRFLRARRPVRMLPMRLYSALPELLLVPGVWVG